MEVLEHAGKTVTHLDYECYVPLAIKTLRSILVEARNLPVPESFEPGSSGAGCHHHGPGHTKSSKIELVKMAAYHLLGPSPPLTPSIVISVAAPHRRDAFYACEWVLEEVKKRVQVWKREWYADGTVFHGQDGQGVEGPGSRARWKENFPSA